MAMPKNKNVKCAANTPLFENLNYWKIDDVVSFTGLAKKTIYNLCSLNEIPHLKQRKRLVFIPQEIQKWFSPTGG
jgi:predicted DNA-binding transcriptional regulator AlpA